MQPSPSKWNTCANVTRVGEPAIREAEEECADGRLGADEARVSGEDEEAPRSLPARLRAAVAGAPVGLWPVVGLVVLYTWYFTRTTLRMHHGLATSTYDFALYDQGVWLLSRLDSPFVTLMGRNLLGDHSSFVLFLVVPLFWIAPGAGTLLFVQSLVIGAGAIPVYLYARRRLEGEALGVIAAAVYLLHPAVSWTNMEQFHPDAFLGLFVGFAIYGALEERWRVYAVSVVLSLMVKEDVSLVIVPLGIWVAIHRDVRKGLLTVAGSVAFMVVAMFVVMRSLIGVPTRNGWRIPFGGVSGIIETALRHPTRLADHFRSEGRPWYVWQMTFPLAYQFVRKPSVAAISALVLFTNILSTFWYQFQIEYHYSLVVVPGLVFGTVYALGTVPWEGRWNRGRSVLAVWLCSLIAAYTWSPLPMAVHQPTYWPPDHPVASAAREIVETIPADASVAAHYRLTPHLAHRSEIYQFPTPFRTVLYGVDLDDENQRLVDRAEAVDLLVLQVDKSPEAAADFEAVRSAFVLERSNEFWEVWRRDRTRPLPPLVLPTP